MDKYVYIVTSEYRTEDGEQEHMITCATQSQLIAEYELIRIKTGILEDRSISPDAPITNNRVTSTDDRSFYVNDGPGHFFIEGDYGDWESVDIIKLALTTK